MRFLGALLISIGLLAPAAHADRWPAAQVQRAIQVADDHWPASHCHGQVQVTWMTGDEIDADPNDGGAAIGTVAVSDQGEFYEGRYWCRTDIAWDRAPAHLDWLCTDLEHEFGHLAGLGHNDNPNSVMYAMGPQRPTADCRAAFPRFRVETLPRRFRAWRYSGSVRNRGV